MHLLKFKFQLQFKLVALVPCFVARFVRVYLITVELMSDHCLWNKLVSHNLSAKMLNSQQSFRNSSQPISCKNPENSILHLVFTRKARNHLVWNLPKQISYQLVSSTGWVPWLPSLSSLLSERWTTFKSSLSSWVLLLPSSLPTGFKLGLVTTTSCLWGWLASLL